MKDILSKKEIGERIKNLRLAHGLSQAHISNILYLSRSNYSQIELGNQFPSFNTLHHIGNYYGKTYEWLLHGSTDPALEQPATKVDVIIKDLESTLKALARSMEKLEKEVSQLKSSNTLQPA